MKFHESARESARDFCQNQSPGHRLRSCGIIDEKLGSCEAFREADNYESKG